MSFLWGGSLRLFCTKTWGTSFLRLALRLDMHCTSMCLHMFVPFLQLKIKFGQEFCWLAQALLCMHRVLTYEISKKKYILLCLAILEDWPFWKKQLVLQNNCITTGKWYHSLCPWIVFTQIFVSYKSVQYKRSVFTFLFNGSFVSVQLRWA